MSITGPKDGPPMKPGPSFGDTAMSLLPPVVLIRAGGLETSQSCQSLGTSWKWFL